MRERKKINKDKWSNLNDNEKFKIWLVGFTDGDGCFSIVKNGGYFKLQYILSQSFYNIKILYYIKKKLTYGSVSLGSRQSWAKFRITDRKVLKQVIFPIFDKYPLLTSKHFNYLRFKKAHYILENPNLTAKIKYKMIESLLAVKLPEDYVSPAISDLTSSSSYDEIADVLPWYWLAGFIEAEGNFSVYPYQGTFNIEFTLVQKLDKILLQLIKRVLHISSNVNFNNTANVHVLNTKHSRSVENILHFSNGLFKGMKSLEFKLWSKANYYKKQI